MPLFAYKALNDSGRRITGTMSATHETDLEDRLGVIGLDLLHCKEKKTSGFKFFGKVKIKDLILFCIHMEQLERAGVPILEAIADLRDTADSAQLKGIMAEVYESIKGGDMLSAALAKHPAVFNSVFVALIEAGEKSGNIAEIFFHLAKHLKWVNNIQTRIRKATYYPTFLLFLMSGIIALMMLFVIPKLSKFLKSQNFDLPLYTEALIATSEFFVESWYYVFATPVVLFIAIKLGARFSEGFAYFLDSLKLKIPYIGSTIRKIELARFSHFFGIMYRSGIGILGCLDSANSVVNNRVIKESAALVRVSVSEGNSLTNSLMATNQFPNLVIRMFKVGEESGNLDQTIENINFFYDREVEDSVNNMIGVIQPTLTLVMGGIMMWVSVAVFGPLYNSFSEMNF